MVDDNTAPRAIARTLTHSPASTCQHFTHTFQRVTCFNQVSNRILLVNCNVGIVASFDHMAPHMAIY